MGSHRDRAHSVFACVGSRRDRGHSAMKNAKYCGDFVIGLFKCVGSRRDRGHSAVKNAKIVGILQLGPVSSDASRPYNWIQENCMAVHIDAPVWHESVVGPLETGPSVTLPWRPACGEEKAQAAARRVNYGLTRSDACSAVIASV